MAKRLLSRRSSLADTLRQHPAAAAVTGVSLLLIPVGAAIYFAGLHTGDHNTILRGILCLFLSNMLYGGVRIRDRIIFLVFHVALFTFLLSRPFISMLQDFAWWTVVTDPDNFGLRALFLRWHGGQPDPGEAAVRGAAPDPRRRGRTAPGLPVRSAADLPPAVRGRSGGSHSPFL